MSQSQQCLHRKRRCTGQSAIVLVIAIAFLFLAPVGLFTFELARTRLAAQQLKNALDAAALTAAATLAVDQSDDVGLAQQHSIAAGFLILQKNSILGSGLSEARLMTTEDLGTPADGAVNVFFELVDPNSRKTVPIGDKRGKSFRVHGVYRGHTAFGAVYGSPCFGIRDIAKSTLPKLDLVLCFDMSSSMDDETPITLVKRKWDLFGQRNAYDVVAAGIQSTVLHATNLGSAVVAVPPMNSTAAYHDQHYWFSEYLAHQSGVPGLRASGGAPFSSDEGLPPGNYSPGSGPTWDGTEYKVFTDIVVNLDGNSQFRGLSAGGYDFPDVATLVEAARGNLENDSVFQSSKANLSLPSSVRPKQGYRRQYYFLAHAKLQPIATARYEAMRFVSALAANSDLHLSLVCFGDTAGSSSGATTKTGVLDMAAPVGSGYGPLAEFAIPFVSLDKSAPHLDETIAQLSTSSPFGGTAIGAAIEAANGQLASAGRADAHKVIVLFTDGIATVSPGERSSTGPPPYAGPTAYARSMAKKSEEAAVPIYTVGLAQNSEIVHFQDDLLNASNSDPSTGGIAGITRGDFFPVANTSSLRSAYARLSRELVQLVYTI